MKRSGLVSLIAVMLVCVVGTAWSGFCTNRIEAGDYSATLIAEQLLVEVEQTDQGTEVRYLLVGVYGGSDGSRIYVDCSGDPGNYVTSGVSV